MTQVLGCHVQSSLLCHNSNPAGFVLAFVYLTKQCQLDSLLQEVCIYDLVHSELKLMGLLVENYTLPGNLSNVILCTDPDHGAG